MKCVCGNELTGRQREFCSDKCRKRAGRTKLTHEDGLQSTNADSPDTNYPDKSNPDTTRTEPFNVGEASARLEGRPPWDTGAVNAKPAAGRCSTRCLPGSHEHYIASPDKYAKRAIPELLNWGPWMSMAALEQAGLKANRVPIPGDWDYAGVAAC